MRRLTTRGRGIFRSVQRDTIFRIVRRGPVAASRKWEARIKALEAEFIHNEDDWAMLFADVRQATPNIESIVSKHEWKKMAPSSKAGPKERQPPRVGWRSQFAQIQRIVFGAKQRSGGSACRHSGMLTPISSR